MDSLFTGRRIINSENHLRAFLAFFDKFFGQKWLFRLFLYSTYQKKNQSSRKSEICRRPFSLAAAEKGGWAQAACPSGLRQALTTPKCWSADTMSILASGGDHWISPSAAGSWCEETTLRGNLGLAHGTRSGIRGA